MSLILDSCCILIPNDGDKNPMVYEATEGKDEQTLKNLFITRKAPKKFWSRVWAVLEVVECYWRNPG